MSAPPDSVSVPLRDDSSVGEVRRAARTLARTLGFDEVEIEEAAIVATEASRNAVLHGGGGEAVLTPGPGRSLDILALDRGPGIADLARAMRDGYSSAGTAGQGLGSISRLASFLDVYTAPGQGTAILARLGKPARAELQVGAVCVAVPPEEMSGDAWAVEVDGRRTVVLVADGLGHGLRAAEAAHVAVTAFRKHAPLPVDRLLERLHQELRPTRGAAIAVAVLEGNAVRFGGIGNISGVLHGSTKTRRMISLPGTAGHEVRTVRGYDYDWPDDGALIMHSDGIATHWDLAAYPGLALHHPALVAGVLYRDFTRRRDDATVVVLRRTA